MMQRLWHDIRELPAGRKALRSFGLTIGSVCLLAAAGIAVLSTTWRAAWILGIVGFSLVALGLLTPRVLRPIHYPWMALAIVLGYLMTNVLLTIVFFLVVTPTGLLMRLFGRDPMQRNLDRSTETYWIPKQYDARATERLTKYH